MSNKIDQSEKVDKIVFNTLTEMSYMWDEAIDKLKTDDTCFKCKCKLEKIEKDGLTEPKINLFNAKNADKGVAAFVCLCDKCVEQLKNEEENN